MSISKIARGQRSEGSGLGEIDYNTLKFRTIYSTELECILNGLPWHNIAL